MRRRVPILLTLLAGVLLAPASAHAFGVGHLFPRVSEISPTRLGVGDQLTIRGRDFVPGKLRDTVVFQRDKARPLFLVADQATATTMTITLPPRLLFYLPSRNGSPVAARFRIRVLSRRFGRAYTTRKLSPVIGPDPLGPEPRFALPAANESFDLALAYRGPIQ